MPQPELGISAAVNCVLNKVCENREHIWEEVPSVPHPQNTLETAPHSFLAHSQGFPCCCSHAGMWEQSPANAGVGREPHFPRKTNHKHWDFLGDTTPKGKVWLGSAVQAQPQLLWNVTNIPSFWFFLQQFLPHTHNLIWHQNIPGMQEELNQEQQQLVHVWSPELRKVKPNKVRAVESGL